MRAVQVRVGDAEYTVGDAVYFVADAQAYARVCHDSHAWETSQAEAVCEVCQGLPSQQAALTECDFCLRNYHATCIPSKSARPMPCPDTLSACPGCRRQGHAQEVLRTTAHSRIFLSGDAALGLGVIRGLTREACIAPVATPGGGEQSCPRRAAEGSSRAAQDSSSRSVMVELQVSARTHACVPAACASHACASAACMCAAPAGVHACGGHAGRRLAGPGGHSRMGMPAPARVEDS
jgi:hypothetical protein